MAGSQEKKTFKLQCHMFEFFSFGADVLDLRISVKLHHYVPRHPSKVPRGLIEKQHV